MSKKKNKRFSIPGIYHKIIVALVTQKWLGRFAKDKDVQALWDPEEVKIYISTDLTDEVRRHSFYHEVAHHILDTLDQVKDEETKCDLLGMYLMNLGENFNRINKNLVKNEPKK